VVVREANGIASSVGSVSAYKRCTELLSEALEETSLKPRQHLWRLRERDHGGKDI
jgi:hypothetical protein